jgi:hypothetical protein
LGKVIKQFEFKQCVSIVKSTGRKARNLRELRNVIAKIGEESIFHHVYQYFLKGHMLEYTNDFAEWAGETLEERALAERMSCIDPYTLKSVSSVRSELLREIDGFLSDFPEPRDVVEGNEFYFNETVNLVFPVGDIDAGSIYYHFYDSRVRLGEGVMDDFTMWIEHTLFRREIADKIRAIDPFMHSTENIREHIKAIIEEHVRADMEGVDD